MKKHFVGMLCLLLCMGCLSGCGGDEWSCGQVAERFRDEDGRLTAFVVETDTGKQVGFRLTEESWITPYDDEFAEEEFLFEEPAGISVSVWPDGRAEKLVTAGGEKVRTYHAKAVHIDELLIPNALTLSDGTSVGVWKSNSWRTNRYVLEDGTELLRERPPFGPENVSVGDLEDFDDLSETAQERVLAFYEEQGVLYDLTAELERAYDAYLACEDKAQFDPYTVGQDISPCASSERAMYFLTTVTLPVSGNVITEVSRCAAFDRQTGERIDTWDLFACEPEAAIKTILDASGVDDFGDTPGLRTEMEAAFDPENILIHQESLEVVLPAGTLPSQEYSYMLGLDYSEVPGLLQDWAVPEPQESPEA